jgi:ketosteroid isomerase-like protein
MTRVPAPLRRALPALAALLFLPSDLAASAGAAREIVEAERAFAASVRARGVRDGFLEWLAPTGIVFKPGPVIGATFYGKQPAGWNGLLDWQPAHAAISADGKLGWSTGPWTWRRDSTQKATDAHGEYMSVWRRAANGRWKVVLDGGIGHPAPAADAAPVRYSTPVQAPGLGSRPLAARKSLYQADASFARLAATEGVPAALEHYATEDLIALREGAFRHAGRAAALAALATRESRARLVSTAQHIAGSGDLGYTYGSWISGPEAAPDSAWYVHVWHRGPAATWRLALQLVMPVPVRK